MNEQKYYRGQIYYIHHGEVTGCEQEGGRPGIIISNDVGNEFSRVVEVVFLTTREKKPLPTHVEIESSRKPSVALCEQIETVDKGRIGNYVNEVTQAELKNIEKAILISLDIASNIKGSKALEAWRKAMEERLTENDTAEGTDNQEEDNKTFIEEVKAVEKVMELPVILQLEDNFENSPAYIRIATERDVYRELYMDLLRDSKKIS